MGPPESLLPSCRYKILFMPFIIYFLFPSLSQTAMTSIKTAFHSKQVSISHLNTAVVTATKVTITLDFIHGHTKTFLRLPKVIAKDHPLLS